MADEPTVTPVVPAPVEPEANAGQRGHDYILVVKWAALAALAASILALDVLGIDAKNYLTLVAAPGLAALGLHFAAKNLS